MLRELMFICPKTDFLSVEKEWSPPLLDASGFFSVLRKCCAKSPEAIIIIIEMHGAAADGFWAVKMRNDDDDADAIMLLQQ